MTDRYTKVVLTVIAISLAIISGKELMPNAHAEMDGTVHVIVDKVAQLAFQYTTVPVKVQK